MDPLFVSYILPCVVNRTMECVVVTVFCHYNVHHHGNSSAIGEPVCLANRLCVLAPRHLCHLSHPSMVATRFKDLHGWALGYLSHFGPHDPSRHKVMIVC
eukprot:scaffold96961_cov52-Attheya_sp.AAC.1